MSEERTARNRNREAKVARRMQLEQLALFMRQPPARQYMYNLLSSCGIYATTFSTNALSMAFREGERNTGLRIVADLTEASPDMYFQMLKEAANERAAHGANGLDNGTANDTGDGADDGAEAG